jgi:hypothetical protein
VDVVVVTAELGLVLLALGAMRLSSHCVVLCVTESCLLTLWYYNNIVVP